MGLQDMCLCCGKSNHNAKECRSRDKLKCTSWKRNGHVAKVCITTLQKKDVQMVHFSDDDFDENFEINLIDSKYKIYDVAYTEDNLSKKIHVSVKLENKLQKFELDTGSAVSILSKKDFKSLNLEYNIKKCHSIRFRTYNKEIIVPEGYIEIPITYKDNSCIDVLYIVSQDLSPILGRVWIRKLNIIDLPPSTQDDNILQIQSEENILNTFSDIFTQEIGKIPDVKCTLKFLPDSTPVYQPPRPVPYALIPKVDAELDLLEKQGIIERVEYSQWGTPLVIVPKPNGTVRLCADNKNTVNKQLCKLNYPIPKVEDLFNKLHGSWYFCVLDIYKAYLHIMLDDESSEIAALSTHRGTYRTKRLFFGIATGPRLNGQHHVRSALIP